MECYSCGFQLPADATTCPRCGQRFQPRDQRPSSTAKPSLIDRIKALFKRSPSR